MTTEQKHGFEPKYDDYKEADVIYVSKENTNSFGEAYRKAETIINQEKNYTTDKNKEIDSKSVEFDVKEKATLYETNGGQQKIQCWLIESSGKRYVQAIHISRRTGKGVYGTQEITLTFEGIVVLKKYLDQLVYMDTTSKSQFKIPLKEKTKSNKILYDHVITKNEFISLIKANITNTDDFYKLLSLQKMEIAVTKLSEIIKGDYDNEIDIQNFLKKNIWMFGNEYVFIIKDNKISASNILDLIPKNIENYIDIIEVKLPSEKLFNYDTSHHNYYSTSNLTKAIAQTQNYIFELENKTKDIKYQTENDCRIIKPRGVILYGTKSELNVEEKKYLRILNASYHNLLIITYQQLLEKARNTINIATRFKDFD